jgi:hypothetical protein
MLTDYIDDDVRGEISKINGKSKTIKNIDISFTIRAVIHTRIFLIGTFFTGFTCIVEFFFCDVSDPTTMILRIVTQ